MFFYLALTKSIFQDFASYEGKNQFSFKKKVISSTIKKFVFIFQADLVRVNRMNKERVAGPLRGCQRVLLSGVGACSEHSAE